MYLGRIVAIGMNLKGRTTAMYRVSSRSFPNREARLKNGIVSIMPRAGHEGDMNENPYIAYNCIRTAGGYAIASNGSHTDPIAEKIGMGMPVRDAIALGLMTMDYEKDNYNTPRIVAVVSNKDNMGYLGVVRKDALIVREFALEKGGAYYVGTYERDHPSERFVDDHFVVENAEGACGYILRRGTFAEFEHPVTSAAAMATDDGFELDTEIV